MSWRRVCRLSWQIKPGVFLHPTKANTRLNLLHHRSANRRDTGSIADVAWRQRQRQRQRQRRAASATPPTPVIRQPPPPRRRCRPHSPTSVWPCPPPTSAPPPTSCSWPPPGPRVPGPSPTFLSPRRRLASSRAPSVPSPCRRPRSGGRRFCSWCGCGWGSRSRPTPGSAGCCSASPPGRLGTPAS